MNNLQTIVILLIALALLFGAPGLIALIPPLRRAARANRAARLALAIGAALVAFLLMDALVSAFTASVSMVFGLFPFPPPESEVGAPLDRDAVQRELFLREFNPLPGPACYTTADACAWADFITKGPPQFPRQPDTATQVVHRLIELASAATSLALVLRLTRKAEAAAPEGG